MITAAGDASETGGRSVSIYPAGGKGAEEKDFCTKAIIRRGRVTKGESNLFFSFVPSVISHRNRNNFVCGFAVGNLFFVRLYGAVACRTEAGSVYAEFS